MTAKSAVHLETESPELWPAGPKKAQAVPRFGLASGQAIPSAGRKRFLIFGPLLGVQSRLPRITVVPWIGSISRNRDILRRWRSHHRQARPLSKQQPSLGTSLSSATNIKAARIVQNLNPTRKQRQAGKAKLRAATFSREVIDAANRTGEDATTQLHKQALRHTYCAKSGCGNAPSTSLWRL